MANTASALTAQSAFLNNFENVVNRRVNIQEDIKRYQDTLSCASSKVDYSVGENIYILPGDMNLKIRSGTVKYTDKIIVSDGKFGLGKNEKVNATAMKSHKCSKTNYLQGLAHAPNISYKKQEPPQSGAQGPLESHEEKISLVLFLTSGFPIWNMF